MRLVIDDVGHRWGSHCLFQHLHLAVDEPQSVAIVGPSGVGKTTLLAILGGLIEPTTGVAGLAPRPVEDTELLRGAEAAAHIGWIFQTTNVFGNKSVHRNVAGALFLRGWSREDVEERTAQVLASVGLGSDFDRTARTLSGGEVQRLGIARAIAPRPAVVLADEPTGQLDAMTTSEVIDALIRNRPPDTTIVVVTHDELVAQACDRIVELTSTGFVAR